MWEEPPCPQAPQTKGQRAGQGESGAKGQSYGQGQGGEGREGGGVLRESG